jgi:hypothetical protein
MNVSANMLTKVLRRNASEAIVATPEGALIMAVLHQAIFDADQKSYQDEARRFFTDGRLDLIAPLIGLDPQFVREVIGKVRPWVKGVQNEPS